MFCRSRSGIEGEKRERYYIEKEKGTALKKRNKNNDNDKCRDFIDKKRFLKMRYPWASLITVK